MPLAPRAVESVAAATAASAATEQAEALMPRCRRARAIHDLCRVYVLGVVVIIDANLDVPELVVGLLRAHVDVPAVDQRGRASDELGDVAARRFDGRAAAHAKDEQDQRIELLALHRPSVAAMASVAITSTLFVTTSSVSPEREAVDLR